MIHSVNVWTFQTKSCILSLDRGVAQLGSALGSGLVVRETQVKRDNPNGFINSRGYPSLFYHVITVNLVKNKGYLPASVDQVLTRKEVMAPLVLGQTCHGINETVTKQICLLLSFIFRFIITLVYLIN